MKTKRSLIERVVRKRHKKMKQSVHKPVTDTSNQPIEQISHTDNKRVSLRHHYLLWLIPTALLILALLPWPYGYYKLLRLIVCLVSVWLAYGQWRLDNAISGWVVALGATAILYNPLFPIHLTREIWSVLNLITAGLFLGHLLALKRLMQT